MDSAEKKTCVFAIRLNARELAIVERLALLEKLPASTLARRMLLMEAERRGIVARDPSKGEPHDSSQ